MWQILFSEIQKIQVPAWDNSVLIDYFSHLLVLILLFHEFGSEGVIFSVD